METQEHKNIVDRIEDLAFILEKVKDHVSFFLVDNPKRLEMKVSPEVWSRLAADEIRVEPYLSYFRVYKLITPSCYAYTTAEAYKGPTFQPILNTYQENKPVVHDPTPLDEVA
ncbi:MAG: hypothetical protein AB9866_21535 [Syntrophobacteraceae bacterium]